MNDRTVTLPDLGAPADILAASARLRALAAALRRRLHAARRASVARQSARELLALDSHLMDDIGLTRGHLLSVLRSGGAL